MWQFKRMGVHTCTMSACVWQACTRIGPNLYNICGTASSIIGLQACKLWPDMFYGHNISLTTGCSNIGLNWRESWAGRSCDMNGALLTASRLWHACLSSAT